MKESEMVKIINDYLAVVLKGKVEPVDRLGISITLLSKIQQAGMLPSPANIEIRHKDRLYTQCLWEPEDEEPEYEVGGDGLYKLDKEDE